jgi:hypothetical protein
LECVILCSEEKLRQEISEVISHIPRISAHYYKDMVKLQDYLYDNSTLFALIAMRQNEDTSPIFNTLILLTIIISLLEKNG